MASLERDLCRILTQHGCHFVRQGKGSHEIWYSPISNINISVPSGIKSRHTANGILKAAGITEKL